LDFFPVDSSYIIIASIEKTPDTPFFEWSRILKKNLITENLEY